MPRYETLPHRPEISHKDFHFHSHSLDLRFSIERYREIYFFRVRFPFSKSNSSRCLRKSDYLPPIYDVGLNHETKAPAFNSNQNKPSHVQLHPIFQPANRNNSARKFGNGLQTKRTELEQNRKNRFFDPGSFRRLSFGMTKVAPFGGTFRKVSSDRNFIGRCSF